MSSVSLRLACVLTALSAVSAIARAQDNAHGSEPNASSAGSYSATAVTRRPIAATSRDDATASGTLLEANARPLALESVAELVREAPGTRAQQLGGFGSFSGLSLRGADMGHTSVLIGNVPLDSIDEGAFDFSVLPLGLFDGVVVYRGGAPAWLGEGSIGGVVQLLPKTARQSQLQAALGAGSYGRYHLSLDARSAPTSMPGFALQSHVALDGAQNDFPYLHPGGTLVDGDERQERTQNAQVTQGNTLVHASIPLAGGEVDVLWMSLGRSGGIPGPQRAPSPNAHRQLGRANLALGYTYRGTLTGRRRYRLQALLGAGYQLNRVSDQGEIGTTFFAETDDRWSNLLARAAASLDVSRALEVTAVAIARVDAWDPENALALRAPPRRSQRVSEIGVIEARLHGDLFDMPSELRGSARAQLSQASIQATRNVESEVIDVDTLTPTLRLAAVTAPAGWLSLGASVSTGQRLPSFGELFGDRAFLQANPELKPERSIGVDVSATVMTSTDDLCLQLEVRAFHLAIDDFITYLRSARYDARPENIGFVTVNGVELGSKLNYGTLAALTLSATAMDTNTALGHQAPNRPNLVLYARPETTLRIGGLVDRITLFTDLSVVTFAYSDKPNLNVIPGRQWLGAGIAAHLLDEQLELQVRASNLLDQQSEDFNGFALPRRALMASLTIQEDL